MYCFGADGKMLTGLQNLNGLCYYFAQDGAMYTGFLDFPEGKRFFSTDGHMFTGLNIVNNKYYYFDDLGSRAIRYGRSIEEISTILNTMIN